MSEATEKLVEKVEQKKLEDEKLKMYVDTCKEIGLECSPLNWHMWKISYKKGVEQGENNVKAESESDRKVLTDFQRWLGFFDSFGLKYRVTGPLKFVSKEFLYVNVTFKHRRAHKDYEFTMEVVFYNDTQKFVSIDIHN